MAAAHYFQIARQIDLTFLSEFYASPLLLEPKVHMRLIIISTSRCGGGDTRP